MSEVCVTGTGARMTGTRSALQPLPLTGLPPPNLATLRTKQPTDELLRSLQKPRPPYSSMAEHTEDSKLQHLST